MHFSLVSGSFTRLPSWLSSSIHQVKPRAELGTLKLRKALSATADAKQLGAPTRTTTEWFAIICHGTWKQFCLVNLTPVTTRLPVAVSCQIHCLLLPVCIAVVCACFLEILPYFPFSFTLLQPRVFGKKSDKGHPGNRKAVWCLPDTTAKLQGFRPQNTGRGLACPGCQPRWAVARWRRLWEIVSSLLDPRREPPGSFNFHLHQVATKTWRRKGFDINHWFTSVKDHVTTRILVECEWFW